MSTERRNAVVTALSAIGNVSGLISILTIVFMGGSLVEKVKALDVRVGAVETIGSPTFREHLKASEQLEISNSKRLCDLEASSKRLSNIEMDVREIRTTVQIMKERQDRDPINR